MFVHVASILVFAFLLFRLILPSPLGKRAKTLAGIALLLVSQQHLLVRALFGSMASPELPRPVLLAQGWLFIALILLFLLTLVRDGARLLHIVARRGKRLWDPPFSPGRRQSMLVLCAALPAAYGVRQAVAVPEVRNLEVHLPRLPRELDGLSLVQISDLHASQLLQASWVRAVVEKVNSLHPDLVLFTGDMVDGLPARRAAAVAPLKDLQARRGIFACAGNHEYYADFHGWMRAFPDLGIPVLLNSHALLDIHGHKLLIAGITDIVAGPLGLPAPNISAALAGAPEGVPRILLAHRPACAASSAQHGIDLQLSGHTHGGQLLGMRRLVAQFNSGYLHGWYQVDNMRMYVNAGAGLWNGFPVRLGVPSEIARFVLRTADPTQTRLPA